MSTPSPLPLLIGLLAAGCGAPGVGGEDTGELTTRCQPGPGVSGRPGTVEEMVALVDSLDDPDVACVLEALERPLGLRASNSRTSAQPAAGPLSPRLFLMLDTLTISVVPEGEGSPLLEMGAWIDETQTIKAEIKFPVEWPLDPAHPYDRALFTDEEPIHRSTCGFCHTPEVPVEVPSGALAFASPALRPGDRKEVPFTEVEALWTACVGDDSERCRMLDAVFGQGGVVAGTWPGEVATIER